MSILLKVIIINYKENNNKKWGNVLISYKYKYVKLSMF